MSRKIFYSVFALCLLGFGFFYFFSPGGDTTYFSKTLTLKDVTQEEIVTLTCDLQKVSGIEIEIFGKIDGTADIYRSYVEKDNKYYELKELKPGAVRLEMGGDWFAPNCVIRYVPEKVRKGWLKIRYKFKTE